MIVLDDDRTYLPGGEPDAVRARAWRRRALLIGAELHGGGPDDPAVLAREVRAAAPDAVVHLANMPLAGVAAADPAAARRSIVDGTANVLAAVAAQAPAARLTFVSSSMVYGDFSRGPAARERAAAPVRALRRVQARGRAARARLGARLDDRAAVRGLRARRRQRPLPAAPRRGGDDRRTLELTADPATRLDFTWVQDLARGLADAATCPDAIGETFNLTAGRSRSLREAIDVVRAGGHAVAVRRRPATTPRPRRGTLDIARARRVLGYRPRCSLEDGLAAYLDAAAGRREPVA